MVKSKKPKKEKIATVIHAKKYFGKGKNKKLYYCDIAYGKRTKALIEARRIRKDYYGIKARVSKYQGYYGVFVRD